MLLELRLWPSGHSKCDQKPDKYAGPSSQRFYRFACRLLSPTRLSYISACADSRNMNVKTKNNITASHEHTESSLFIGLTRRNGGGRIFGWSNTFNVDDINKMITSVVARAHFHAQTRTCAVSLNLKCRTSHKVRQQNDQKKKKKHHAVKKKCWPISRLSHTETDFSIGRGAANPKEVPDQRNRNRDRSMRPLCACVNPFIGWHVRSIGTNVRPSEAAVVYWAFGRERCEIYDCINIYLPLERTTLVFNAFIPNASPEAHFIDHPDLIWSNAFSGTFRLVSVHLLAPIRRGQITSDATPPPQNERVNAHNFSAQPQMETVPATNRRRRSDNVLDLC